MIGIHIAHAVQIFAQFLEIFPIRLYGINPDVLSPRILEHLRNGIPIICTQIHVYFIGRQANNLPINLRLRRCNIQQIANVAADLKVNDAGIHPAGFIIRQHTIHRFQLCRMLRQ